MQFSFVQWPSHEVKASASRALIAALKKHLANPVIAQAALQGISNLSVADQSIKDAFGAGGACQAAVVTLRVHKHNAAVAQWACAVMHSLAAAPDAAARGPVNVTRGNCLLLIASGACEAIVETFNIHFHDATVVQRCLAPAVALLSIAAAVEKFALCGLPEVVVSAMRCHDRDATIAELATNVLVNFMSHSPETAARRLSTAGAGAACERLLLRPEMTQLAKSLATYVLSRLPVDPVRPVFRAGRTDDNGLGRADLENLPDPAAGPGSHCRDAHSAAAAAAVPAPPLKDPRQMTFEECQEEVMTRGRAVQPEMARTQELRALRLLVTRLRDEMLPPADPGID